MAAPAPGSASRAHVVLIPSAGVGQLTPFAHLAARLSPAAADVGATISFVSVTPTVSDAESALLSSLFSSLPGIKCIDFHLTPEYSSGFSAVEEPFIVRFEVLRRCAGTELSPLLAAAQPPVTALVVDFFLASALIPVARELGIPCFVLFTCSAKTAALFAHFPTHLAHNGECSDVDVPGLGERIARSCIPQPLRYPKHLFTTVIVENSKALPMADGILLNTFQFLENGTLSALNSGEVSPSLPPVMAIGPLGKQTAPAGSDIVAGKSAAILWLDEQPAMSVVYVCFGSCFQIRKEQIKQLAFALEMSQCRFLWVLKDAKVDKEDTSTAEDVVGEAGFLDRVKGRGMVIRGWVEQQQVLRHAAVGCFISHCGWNSVTEAAAHGVPTLAWPRLGDQRINAGIVAECGMGVWKKEWQWVGEKGLVAPEVIADAVKEVMGSAAVRAGATAVAEAAAKAVADGGTSSDALFDLIKKLIMI